MLKVGSWTALLFSRERHCPQLPGVLAGVIAAASFTLPAARIHKARMVRYSPNSKAREKPPPSGVLMTTSAEPPSSLATMELAITHLYSSSEI